MLVNLWYVVQESRNVRSQPLPVRLLGQDLVLFRNASGQVVCLSAVCVHRGASLARGRTVDDTIECPFHGWRYDAAGRCVRVPAHPDAAIPPRARVDAYPTIERYGWVWVFVGDLPEQERPPLPVLEAYGTEPWRFVHGDFLFRANWERTVENGLDASHAPFVHGTAFGDRDRPEVMDFSIERHEWGASGEITMFPPKPSGLWGWRTPDRPPVKTSPHFHMCGVLVGLKLEITAKMTIWIYTAHSPIDESTTRAWWVMGRNFLRSPLLDRNTIRRNRRIFEQDAAVIEHVRPVHVPGNAREEVTVKSDALQIEFRRLVRRL
ncbi:MAG TPA: aromatic ring-hydroxylating dioxygenase subunit alpha, partial [Steroidobacteraceae bacterium]|nr:aromatic ring-hydroxylating dioxygenase subunit alpha [Steroidobacteraceae bacterium]